MHSLLIEVTSAQGRAPQYDGVLPSVAGVQVKVGMTGGSDYLFEYHDTKAQDYQARDYKDEVWKVTDNPLDGTH
jgi:hypothetical protein